MSDWDNPTDGKSIAKGAPPKEGALKPIVRKDKDDEDRIKFDDEQIKKWLFGQASKSCSNVCCAIYGHDGTAKSGIALDCRTDEEKKAGAKIIVFDLDGGCAPLKVIYHDNDENIIIKNPLVRDDDKNIDYEATFAKLKASLDYIERNMEDYKIKAIIFDGIDKFLKICEYSMRDDVGKSVEDGIDYRYWKIRNQKYQDIMEQIHLMDIDRYFITHLKKLDEAGNWGPDWEKKTPDMMFQRVSCYRETKVVDGNKVVQLKADIDKCKTNLALEGRSYVIAEIIQNKDNTAEAKWHGLYFGKDNTIKQKNMGKGK